MEEILRVIIPTLSAPALFLLLLLFIPEKIEKWSALLWKILSKMGNLFRVAHKKHVKHDLQGRVNDFVKRLRKEVPDIESEKLKIEWVDPTATRESVIADGNIILRLKRDDPADHNFVHGALLFISGTLLRKPKRYLSPSQRDALDLFVCSKLIREEKPSCVGFFLDEYLHPKTEDPAKKIARYLDDFAIIDEGRFFFPIFVQELRYLGDKVFGQVKQDIIIKEVNELIEFIKKIAERRIGEEIDLTFNGSYCKFGMVIIGKPKKLLKSLEPYITYIRNELADKNAETIYILGRVENKSRLRMISTEFAEDYRIERQISFDKILKYNQHERKSRLLLIILRRKTVELIRASTQ